MLFGRRDDGGRAAAVRRVKEWVEVLAHVGQDDAVMVTELQCTEDGCPPVETVLAVLRSGREPQKWKVHKAVADVTEGDVRAAVRREHVLQKVPTKEDGGHS